MWISRDCGIMFGSDQNLSCDQQQQPKVADSPDWAGTSTPWDSFTEGVAPWEGEYEKAFDTLKQIGKGAFGHVNLAQRKRDQLVVKLLNISQCFVNYHWSLKRSWLNLYARTVFYKTVGLRMKNLAACHLR